VSVRMRLLSLVFLAVVNGVEVAVGDGQSEEV